MGLTKADREGTFQKARINTNTTTVVKASRGFLRLITVGDPGSVWIITIYDNTAGSGTVVGVIKPTVAHSFEIKVDCQTGITIVTSGTTPGDLIVSFA